MNTANPKNNSPVVPIIFGEVLFDCFPDGNSVLGGAPFNVAWHLQAFDQSPLMVSSVGDDAQGEKVKSAMQSWDMNTSALQIDLKHATGSVDIKFDQGEPHYTIVEHSAYDYINTALLPALSESSLLYHGSLALRNQTSRETLANIKALHTGTVFMDVNLRDPWWQKASVLEMVSDADWVKLNEDELLQLGRSTFGHSTDDIRSLAADFINTYNLTAVIVTLGATGAIVLTNNDDYVRVAPSRTLEVVDTVGAGDAFTSVLILGILLQWPLEQTMQRAQDFASLMVTQQGATVFDHDLYKTMVTDWCL
jgi:fructokinase